MILSKIWSHHALEPGQKTLGTRSKQDYKTGLHERMVFDRLFVAEKAWCAQGLAAEEVQVDLGLRDLKELRTELKEREDQGHLGVRGRISSAREATAG